MKDIYNNISVVQALAPIAIAADSTGSAIDLAGYNSAMIIWGVGVVTDGTYAIQIEESDTTTAGDFTAVADADLIGTEKTGVTTTNDNAVYSVGYKGSKRYIRYVISETAAGSTGGVMEVIVLKGNAAHAPVN
ncbi:MAG: hypothetical protein WC375_05270 [Methanomassiliicoccales archaeon]|jgi:hypothetical protein